MLDAQFVDRIGWTLIHSVWQLILLAYVVAICNRLLLRQSANGRYLVGCVGLLAMAVTPIATFSVLSRTNESSRSGDASALTRIGAYDTLVGSDPAPQDSTARTQRGSLSHIPADDIPTTSDEEAWRERAGQEHRGEQNESVESIAAASHVWRDRVEVWLQPALPSIVVIWFIGAMLLSARPLFGLYTVHRLRHIGHSDVEGRVVASVHRLCLRMGIGKTVEVAESALLNVPAVIGFFRPLLLLPATAVTGMTPQQLDAVIAHELAHVRRHDYIVNLLQTLVETLLFYHPAAWWVSHLVRQERENCCDDIAVAVCRDRRAYANALLLLEQLRDAVPPPTLAANGGSLLQRIRRIAAANLTPEPPGSRLAGSVLSLALLTAAMSIVATAPNVSGDEEVQPKSVQHQVGPDGPKPPTNTGTLRGRVVFNGTPPPRNKIAIDKDHVALEGKELFDESLIVDTGGGVANVFIWLQDANVPAPPVDKPPPPATLRIKNLRYDPHALAMTTSQKLLVVNDDPVAASPIFRTQTNPPTNMVTPRNSKHTLQFHKAERLPIPVTASVHPWLKASLLVRDNPYFAITGEDGRFEIKNLPPGEWTFQFWHESAGYLKHKTGWPKGRLGVTINEGVSDIGKIDVTYEDFDLSRPAEAELEASGTSWFRRAPYPEIGYAQPYEVDRVYVSMSAHPPAQAELGVSDTQVVVLNQLHQWAAEEKHFSTLALLGRANSVAPNSHLLH